MTDRISGALNGKDVEIAVRKFGRNADIDTTTDPEDVIGTGGVYTGFPLTTTTPELVEVFSSDANDTAGGTGARTVTISGLKTATSTAYETETITLNGVTAVDSVNTWYRVNRMWVATAGSGLVNAGTLTARWTTTTSVVFTSIPIGFGQSQTACWTVPAQKTMYLRKYGACVVVSGGGAGSATVAIMTRGPAVTDSWRIRGTLELSSGEQAEREFGVFTTLAPGTDIKLQVVEVTVNNTVVSGYFEAVKFA